ncbi:MAG: T9SS type A sorting domain-containing protein [Flavobacteriales bacterium]|nr:T9SS type A sorting domain-containing protein [Flavobacteriales bacterium]
MLKNLLIFSALITTVVSNAQVQTNKTKNLQNQARSVSENISNTGMIQAGFQDTDDDGLPDFWEIQHNLDINDPSDAYIDLDNDAVYNLFEFQLSSDPYDSLSPHIIQIDSTMSLQDTIESLSQPTVIRLQYGEYSYVQENLFNIDSLQFLIQGGWNEKFSKWHHDSLTKINHLDTTKEGFYFNPSSGKGVWTFQNLILDESKNFGGSMFLISDNNMDTCFITLFNCRITNSEGSFSGLLVDNWMKLPNSYSENRFINTLFARSFDDGIHIQNTHENETKLRFINCTSTQNGVNQSADGIRYFTLDNATVDAKFYNTIAWGNYGDDINEGGTVTRQFIHSDIDAVSGFGTNVLPDVNTVNIYPEFIDSTNANFHLDSALSTLVDAGLDVGLPFNDLAIDIGCFESGTPSAPPTTILESRSYSSLKIFPNPTTEKLHIPIDEKEHLFEIYSVTGERLSTKTSQVDDLFIIDVGALPNGIYVIQDLVFGKSESFVKID